MLSILAECFEPSWRPDAFFQEGNTSAVLAQLRRSLAMLENEYISRVAPFASDKVLFHQHPLVQLWCNGLDRKAMAAATWCMNGVTSLFAPRRMLPASMPLRS